MAAFVWDAKYSVEIREIDEQHKKLFALINELYDSMQEGKGKEVLGKVLGDLIEYTKSHFSREEQLMKENVYPSYNTHKLQHESLTRKAMELKEKNDRGEIALSVQVGKFLKDWLSNHILGTDKMYTTFFNNRGIN